MTREHAQCLCMVGSVAIIIGGIVGFLMLFAYLGTQGVSPVTLSCAFLGLIGGFLCLCALVPVKNARLLDVSSPTSTPMGVTILQLPTKDTPAP
jgi:hypothetical protein